VETSFYAYSGRHYDLEKDLSELWDLINQALILGTTTLKQFSSPKALIQDTSLSYDADLLNTVLVTVGARVAADTFLYEILDQTATYYDILTQGGVKLKVLQVPGVGYLAEAFGANWTENEAVNTPAIQRAINAASRSNFGVVRLPGGVLRVNTLYGHYDAVNNPEFNSGSNTAQAALSIFGNRTITRGEYSSLDVRGTVLKYIPTSGHCLITGDDGITTNGQRVHLADFAVIGATSGDTVRVAYANRNSIVERLFLANEGTGSCLKLRSIWACTFRDMDMRGNQTAAQAEAWIGYGIHLDNGPGTTGGGMNVFSNITCSYFAVGMKLGNEYDVANTQQRVITLIAPQVRHCREGMQILQGVQASIIGIWQEHNAISVRCSDSCSDVDIKGWHGDNPPLTNTSIQEGVLVLGRSSGTANQKLYGNVYLSHFSTLGCRSTQPGIRRYSFLGAPILHISNLGFNDQGGFGILVDSTDHGGIIFGTGVDISTFVGNEARLIGSGIVGAPVYQGQFIRGEFNETGGFSGTADFTPLWFLPDTVYVNTATASCTVLLPNDVNAFLGFGQPIHFIKPQGTNGVTIDAGTGNTIMAAQTLAMPTSAYQYLQLVPYKASNAGVPYIRWDVMVKSF